MRLTVVALLAIAASSPVLQPIDWTGSWMSGNGDDVQIIRNVRGTGTTRGWNALAEMLRTPGVEPDELKLRVFVADEKGELEYVQTFRRER